MKTQHTKVPWAVGEIGVRSWVIDLKGNYLFEDCYEDDEGFFIADPETRRANLQHAVDCVNACDGISNVNALPDILGALQQAGIALRSAGERLRDIHKLLADDLLKVAAQVQQAIAKANERQ